MTRSLDDAGGRHALVFAPAKINLCLHITGVRPDGYHLLDSLVVPVRLFDHLSIGIDGSARGEIDLCCHPADSVPGGNDNLVMRAARLFTERTGWRRGIRLTLHKTIPVGAGLGGGSSDAAAVLRGLNALTNEPVERSLLAEWALELGADVPLFIHGRAVQMRGIGEQIEPTTAPLLPGQPLVVAFPGTGLRTADVYARYDRSLTSGSATTRIGRLSSHQGSLQTWLKNDLEAAAFELLPALSALKRQLCALGARGVLMSGSGSAVFGIWNHRGEARAAAAALRRAGLWARATEILERIPAIEVDGTRDGRSPSW